MRRLAIVLLTGIFAGSSSSAQNAPTFRIGTTLVEFTVVVLDDDGHPVTDLTKDEVTLAEAGRPQEIAFFRFDGRSVPVSEMPSSPLPEGFVTNQPDYVPAPQNGVTAIVMDLLNTAPNEQSSVLAQMARYLRTLAPNTRAALYRFSDDEPVAMLQELTDNPDLLRTRVSEQGVAQRRELATTGPRGNPIVGGDCYILAGIGGSASSTTGSRRSTGRAGGSSAGSGAGMAALGGAAADAEAGALAELNKRIRDARLAKTLANLEAVGAHLSGIPGRKSIVWITGGMPLLLTKNFGHNYEPQIREAARRLANRGIAIYPVDAKGLCRAGDTSTDEGGGGSHDAPQMVFASFDVVADTTGGRVLKNTNNPMTGVAAAADDQRGTYTIGFYAADEGSLADDWHPIDVSVKRRGVRVRHREGYFSARRAQPQSLSEDGWNELAHAPLGSTGIRLNARSDAGGDRLTLLLQVAAADLYFHERDGRTLADVEIGLVEQAVNGPIRVRSQTTEITLKDPTNAQRSQLIELSATWTLERETSGVRVIVRDRFTGRYGTLDMPVEEGPRP